MQWLTMHQHIRAFQGAPWILNFCQLWELAGSAFQNLKLHAIYTSDIYYWFLRAYHKRSPPQTKIAYPSHPHLGWLQGSSQLGPRPGEPPFSIPQWIKVSPVPGKYAGSGERWTTCGSTWQPFLGHFHIHIIYISDAYLVHLAHS